jgi:hypothetical protein
MPGALRQLTVGSPSYANPGTMRRMSDRLRALRGGFRSEYLSHDAITEQLSAWAIAFPELAHLESIGKTPEGRDLWVLTIGADRARVRPAVWVDGNMHATELCGSSVALAIAEDALAIHAGASPEVTLPAAVLERLRDVVFHVMPRMSPDGAETVLRTGRYVRSVPRDGRAAKKHARWVHEDVDGDGVALLMRVRDPAGEYADAGDGLLVPRELADEGPFYRLYPEGRIEHFDGTHVPVPSFLSDNDPDLNRNFPFDWRPEPEQQGAGSYATSEPEARAVVEYAMARPNLYAWLNLHTYGGCFIRPAGDVPDTKVHPEDLAVFKEVGDWCEAETGYPMVSGFEEFTYEPDKPLRGDLIEWAYRQRGCLAYVCELWDLFKQLGMPRPKRFVDSYGALTRVQIKRLVDLDKAINQGRIFRPWRAFTHPQLGDVEIGGLDPRVGISNPPLSLINDVCRSQSAAWMRTAALLPRVRVVGANVVALGDGLSRVDVHVENDGYLGTTGIASARGLPWNEALWAEATPSGNLTLVTPSEARQELGHLDGWGRGKGSGAGAIWFARSRGTSHRSVARFVVRGGGALHVSVGSCRVGQTSVSVDV